MDFINEIIDGDKFENLSDLKYSKNIINDINNFDGLPIVYLETENVLNLFNTIKSSNLNKNIILISHNSDMQVRKDLIKEKPDAISYWFANNLIDDSDNIETIPTGLERQRWFPHFKKNENINKVKSMDKEIKNLSYLCHNVDTDASGVRRYLYKHFNNKTWVTVEYGKNGLLFNSFIKNVRNHEYVFCAVGNQTGNSDGDCAVGSHRFWETLYLGTIPIILKRKGNLKYNDLPILYVDNWEDVTEELLYDNLNRIKDIKNNDKLFFSYWEKKIKNKQKELKTL